MSDLLEVADLHSGYNGVAVLRGVNFALGAGEIVAVLGANGVGKTTLNKVLSGLLPAWSGEIRFAGVRIDRASAPAIVAAGLIQVPEGRKIFPDMNVRENLILGSYRRGRANRGRNLERVLGVFPRLRERIGVPERGERRVAGRFAGRESGCGTR